MSQDHGEDTLKHHRAAAALACLVAAGPAVAYDGWHLEHAITFPGKSSGWDYVSFDAMNDHVFLGHRKDGL